ncbi:importin-like protein [Achlya hypogyna]|uniref:Importin-like protein n=1 Tax=Achlya hypogyna TaxID=1202772 RepID=A0A1V9YGF0_ACHHY|nr:importin-like protein [Achlya hypogyna]
MSSADLILQLLNNDNNVRREAEAAYTRLKTEQPVQLTSTLLSLSCVQSNPTEPTTRAFAPVLLRRVLETEGISHLEIAYRETLKAQLLAALGAEPLAHIRRKLGHAIAELARLEASWPELLPAVVALAQHPDTAMQITSLDVLGTLSEYMGPTLRLHHDQFFNLFSTFIGRPASPRLDLRVAAAKAMVAYIVVLESAQAMQPFTQLLLPLLQVAEELLQSSDELSAREVLSALLVLSEAHPAFLQLHLDAICGAMLQLARQRTFEPETRELALEILLSLSTKASSAGRSAKPLLESLVPTVLELMTELDDAGVAHWTTLFDDSPDADDDDARMSDTGASALLRLTNDVGGKAMLPIALPMLSQAMQAGEWQKRHAALYALGLMGEGANAQLYKELPALVSAVLHALSDGHPRVRYAALFCLGQWTEDFGQVDKGKNFQAKFHSAVLPQLIPMIAGRESVLRTRALAANVVCTFCHPEHCKAAHVTPVLDPLLSALFETLGSTPREVQEQAITAVACVATVVGDAFVQYYNVFMPVAKQVLLHAHGKQFALLRGKAMESVALIGQAVGKDAFLADARGIMDMLLRHHELHMKEDAVSVEAQYLSQACVRIGSVLKEDFVPYLPVLVPRLLAQALTPPDIVILDVHENELEDDDEDLGEGIEQVVVDVRGQGKKKVQIQTSSLDEKLMGVNMLYQCAMDLQGAFVPYISEVLAALLPLLRFEYMESVRLVSGFTLSKLVHAAVDGSEPASDLPQSVFSQAFGPLLQALDDEKELECLAGLTEAVALMLQECKEAADAGYRVGVPVQDLPTVIDKLLAAAHASVKRRMAREYGSADADDAEEDADEDEEDAILQNLVDAMGWCIKQHKAAVVPLFLGQLLPAITPYLAPSFPAVVRAHFICTLDDVLEHCGADPLLPTLLPHLWNGLEDSHPNVIRASAYGAGVCAQFGGAAFDAHCVATLQRVWRCIQALEHDPVDTDQAAARDNCVSAVGKFCQFRAGLVDAPTLLRLWLQCLPLQSDALEAQVVHAELVAMVELRNMDLLGTDYVHLGAVLQKFAAILALNMDEDAEPVLDEDTEERLAAVLQSLQTTVPGHIVQAAWGSLSPQEQQVFAML